MCSRDFFNLKHPFLLKLKLRLSFRGDLIESNFNSNTNKETTTTAAAITTTTTTTFSFKHNHFVF